MDARGLSRLSNLGWLTVNRDYLLASEQTQQLYNSFELLFGTFEELIVSCNVSTGVSNGSGAKVGQLGFLSIISERVSALKKVLADWACCIYTLSLPLDRSVEPAGKKRQVMSLSDKSLYIYK